MIKAYENGETAAYLYDDEAGETIALEVTPESYAVEEPDPTSYGTWVPGLPVLVENLLEAMGVSGVLASLILDGVVGGVGAVLGFGSWQAAVATITGLIAKEEVVSTMQVFYPGDLIANITMTFTAASGYSFMVFNLLCAPCFAAMGAIKREMNNAKWTWAAIGYMCGFAYTASLIVYQLGGLLTGMVNFSLWTVSALVALTAAIYLLVRKGCQDEERSLRQGSVAADSK